MKKYCESVIKEIEDRFNGRKGAVYHTDTVYLNHYKLMLC